MENQPPVEVRTRTPSEIRTFSVSAKVTGKWRLKDAAIMKVTLCYASNSNSPAESVVSPSNHIEFYEWVVNFELFKNHHKNS